jgi:hypothetical protein
MWDNNVHKLNKNAAAELGIYTDICSNLITYQIVPHFRYAFVRPRLPCVLIGILDPILPCSTAGQKYYSRSSYACFQFPDTQTKMC